MVNKKYLVLADNHDAEALDGSAFELHYQAYLYPEEQILKFIFRQGLDSQLENEIATLLESNLHFKKRVDDILLYLKDRNITTFAESLSDKQRFHEAISHTLGIALRAVDRQMELDKLQKLIYNLRRRKLSSRRRNPLARGKKRRIYRTHRINKMKKNVQRSMKL